MKSRIRKAFIRFCGCRTRTERLPVADLHSCKAHVESETELNNPEMLSFRHDHANPVEVFHYQYARRIIRFRNVTVFPNNSLIVTKENNIVRESALSNYRLHRLLQEKGAGRKASLSITTPCAAIEQGSMDNYYHWHLDILPRLYGLYHPDIQRIPEIRLLITEKTSESRKRLLKSLVPGNVTLHDVSSGVRIRAESYIHLPYLSDEWAGYLPKEYLNFFREKIEEIFPAEKHRNQVPLRRILISRRDAGFRRFTNEEELLGRLEPLGFELYKLSDYKLEEQVRLFRDAEAIVGMHGAGLTNMIFSRRAKILEILPSNYPGLNHYRLLAAALGHEYGHLACGKVFRPDELQVPWRLHYDLKIHDADIEVNPDAVVAQLKNMGVPERSNGWDSIGPRG